MQKSFKEQQLYHLRLRLVKLLNILMLALPFGLCWFMYYAPALPIELHRGGKCTIVLLFALLFGTFCRLYGGFRICYSRISELFFSQVLAVTISDGFMFIVLWCINAGFPNLLPALGVLAAQYLLSYLWCKLAHLWYFRKYPAKRSAVIHDDHDNLAKLVDQYGMAKKFDIVKTATPTECVANLAMLDDVDTVFLSGIHSHERNVIVKYCVEKNIQALVIPRVGDVIMSGAFPLHLFHLPMLQVSRYNPRPEFVFFKRLFDLLFSLVLLIVFSPVMLAVIIAVKSDGGPAFYRQKRLTKDGKVFELIKFRSMRVDAEKDGVARLASDHDDRITPVGRFIRACRLDELPQLINILRGEMSLIGPRPERPEIAAEYEKELPEFRLRLQAKAGLTGYAQVYGKYNTSPYDKLQMDLMYIARPSILQDLEILFATVRVLFMKESTEGVAKGNTTAADAGESKSA
ncbi:MAG: sugar transferase [Clostridia bacterium]|nr:sugar transferase [Clostridia bacterium]